jgi:Tfp pilus assembly protein PilO
VNWKKLPKEKKERLIAVCLGTGLLLALLNFFLIGFQQDRLAELERAISDRKDKVAKADQMVRMSARIAEKLEQTRKAVQEQEALMPSLDQYRWVVETIPPFMHARNVQFEECTPKPKVQNVTLLPKFSTYKTAAFTIKASATFHDFGKFLAEFENQYQYVTIENLKIRPVGSRAGKLSTHRIPLNDDPEQPHVLEFDMQVVCLIPG